MPNFCARLRDFCTVQTHAEVEKAKLVPSQARPRSGLQSRKSSSASHRCSLAARPNQACRRPGSCRCRRCQGCQDLARNIRETNHCRPQLLSQTLCPLFACIIRHSGFKAACPARVRRSNVADLPLLSLPPHVTINCAICNLKRKDNGLNRKVHSLPTCLPTLPSLASILPALPALSAFSVLLWSCALVFALKCVDATASQCASLLLLAAGTISWQLSPWVRVLCAL